MPRYYCDYCDTYLTHDSPSVRKQHNAGYKHKANVREYYQSFEQQQTQILIDQKIKEHLGQAAAYRQVGAAFNQHLASFPGTPQQPRPPLLPPPVLPISGAAPSPLVPGYGAPPTMVPVAPPLSAPTTVPGVVPAPGSHAAPSAFTQAMYLGNPTTGSTTTPAPAPGTAVP
ncbi:hypothetical protein LguiA_031144 [Lonicera macranthoides]